MSFSPAMFFNSLCGLRGHHLLQPTNFQESCAGLRWSPYPRWGLTCSGPSQIAAVEPSCTNQNYQQGHSYFFRYIQTHCYLHLIFLVLNAGSIYLMDDLEFQSGTSLGGFAELQNSCSCEFYKTNLFVSLWTLEVSCSCFFTVHN